MSEKEKISLNDEDTKQYIIAKIVKIDCLEIELENTKEQLATLKAKNDELKYIIKTTITEHNFTQCACGQNCKGCDPISNLVEQENITKGYYELKADLAAKDKEIERLKEALTPLICEGSCENQYEQKFSLPNCEYKSECLKYKAKQTLGGAESEG